MSFDIRLASSYSTDTFKKESIDKFIKCVDNAIKDKLEDGTMTETDGKILRKMIIRIQTDTNLLNAIKGFIVALSTLDINWTIGNTSVLNDNMDTNLKLASLLTSIFG